MKNDQHATALPIAYEAHEGQMRKYSNVPYIIHPISVAAIVCDRNFHVDIFKSLKRNDTDLTQDMVSDTLKAIAVLHDVLEDTDWTTDMLSTRGISNRVIEGVETLTHDTTTSYADYIKSLTDSCDVYAMAVKLADLLHNMSDLHRGALYDKYLLAHMFVSDKFRLCVGPHVKTNNEHGK